MRISHQHRFVWLSKPKTGSTSVRKLLDRHSDIKSKAAPPFRHHTTLPELEQIFRDNGWSLGDYRIYLCERNPWDLVRSVWKYSRINVKHQQFWDKDYDADAPRLSFPDFLSADRSWGWLRARHRLEVYTGPDPSAYDLAVYDIGSQTAQLLADLSARIGQPLGELGQHNRSDYSADDVSTIRQVYGSADVDARIRSTFTTSIQRFGYTNPFA